jgi:hypothetical protein
MTCSVFLRKTLCVAISSTVFNIINCNKVTKIALEMPVGLLNVRLTCYALVATIDRKPPVKPHANLKRGDICIQQPTFLSHRAMFGCAEAGCQTNSRRQLWLVISTNHNTSRNDVNVASAGKKTKPGIKAIRCRNYHQPINRPFPLSPYLLVKGRHYKS